MSNDTLSDFESKIEKKRMNKTVIFQFYSFMFTSDAINIVLSFVQFYFEYCKYNLCRYSISLFIVFNCSLFWIFPSMSNYCFVVVVVVFLFYTEILTLSSYYKSELK